MPPSLKYERLVTECLDSNTSMWLVNIAMLCIGVQRGTDSHGGYLQSWPRCLGRVLWAFMSCPGTDMATAYRSTMPPIQNQRRCRSERDAFKSGKTRYNSHWDRYTHERWTTTTAPTSNARRRKQCSWRLPNDDQFGMHNPRRSGRMRRTHIPTRQDASGQPPAGGEVLWSPIQHESSGTFQLRLALAGPN